MAPNPPPIPSMPIGPRGGLSKKNEKSTEREGPLLLRGPMRGHNRQALVSAS